MPIGFNNIPNTLRVPFQYIEFDNTKANQGPAIQKYTTLVVGQMLAAGTATALTKYTITSEAQARTLFGAGSILHGMLAYYLDNDKITELVAIAQDDDGSAVDATGKITIATGTATADGTIALYIAGRLINVSVTSGDDQDAIATAMAAAIQAESLSYVSAVVNGVNADEVDLTAKNGGEAGNQIDVRFNYNPTDEFPAGTAIPSVTTPMASGATNPDFDDVTAVLAETQYNTIVHTYTDATNLGKIETELADRFGPIRQNDGIAYAAEIDTHANLTTLGNSRNSPHSSIMGVAGPSAPWEWASAYGAQVAKAGQADPARPFQTLPLTSVLAPTEAEQFTLTERNNLLFDGIATYNVVAGQPQIERAITTYQLNSAGAADTSYLDVNTLLTLSFLRFSLRTRFQTRYPRHKLANDGTRFASGQQVMTPALGRAEVVGLFSEWELAGLVEGIEQFKTDLVVERNSSDVNRLDVLLGPDLINQFRVLGAQIQFLL
jgi:phage tail sheath gpL-like